MFPWLVKVFGPFDLLRHSLLDSTTYRLGVGVSLSRDLIYGTEVPEGRRVGTVPKGHGFELVFSLPFPDTNRVRHF